MGPLINSVNSSVSFDLPVSLRIRGSIDEVFDAWINPSVAVNWLYDGCDGHWKPGKSVYWVFGDFRQEIRVTEVEPNKLLLFRWNAYGSRPETEVRIEFRDLGNEVGLVLHEGRWALTLEDVKVALDLACGWENIFCRLKAWIEAKVKLR